jgi:hypothetical protein
MRATTPVPNGAGDEIGTDALLGTGMLGTVPVGAGVDCALEVAVFPGVVPDEGPDVAEGVEFDDVHATRTAAAVAHDAATNAATRAACARLDRARTPLPSSRL